MKRIIFYIIITCCGLSRHTLANAQEKAFQGSYADCQAQAKKENKLILVDLYFVGCMPCAEMDKQVFPAPAVSSELAANYILFKTDVMKEMDGKRLARKYGAPGFPTYVIVNPDGKTILTESGFFDVNRFVSLLKKGVQLNVANQYLAFNRSLDNPYPAAYSERFIKTGEQHTFAELEGYLDQQKDLFHETAFLANSVTGFPKYNSWAYHNLPKLINMYGGNLLRNKITAVAKAKSRQYGTARQLDSLQHMLAYIRPTFNDKLWAIFLPGFITDYYSGSKDAATYLTLIDKYKIFTTWDLRSNALGQVIIDQAEKPEILQQLLDEYQQQQRKQPFDAVDNYRLTLLYYYLKDYARAAHTVDAHLRTDLTSTAVATRKNEIIALQKAIAKKDSKLFQAKDIKKIIPFNLS
ncbi:thioredoxin family protein [Sphingobacterium sp. N143]|uniref:thioredoxin family protein n=1 Tax=Sphingobacterium sp. N143 TaxID=2746727 RepID=UPI002576717B|nr:thioredoxin family protein [Sphingobacterium sp. N143]MDM1295387.1 thioredoxin family protein [Sphingobacterium sp. N143]